MGNFCRWSMLSGAAFTRMQNWTPRLRYGSCLVVAVVPSRRRSQLLARSHAHTPGRGHGPASWPGDAYAWVRGILERTTRSAVRTTRRPRRIALSVGGRLSLRRVLERIDPCSYASTALAMATSQRHRHVGLSVCACIAVCFHVAHASRIRPRACFSCSSTAIAPLHSCEHDATPPEANWTSSDFSLCFQVE